jgi:hypothetical protein
MGRMTHEYVIAVGGRIEPRRADLHGLRSTAVGWAADAVLAVGSDELVRAISRGDSTFLDLGGCVVTALPHEQERADTLVRESTAATAGDVDIGALLSGAGLLEPGTTLEAGSPADLAFWGTESGNTGDPQAPICLVAIVRAGAFASGDEHRGPFPAAAAR